MLIPFLEKSEADRIAELESENDRYRIALDAAGRISQRGMEAQRRVGELEAALDLRGTGTMALLEKRNEQLADLANRFVAFRRENEQLQAQLVAALATIEAAAHPTEWCDDCGMPDEHCPDCSTVYNPVDYWCCPVCRRGDQFATGQDYAEGCAL